MAYHGFNPGVPSSDLKNSAYYHSLASLLYWECFAVLWLRKKWQPKQKLGLFKMLIVVFAPCSLIYTLSTHHSYSKLLYMDTHTHLASLCLLCLRVSERSGYAGLPHTPPPRLKRYLNLDLVMDQSTLFQWDRKL